MASMDFICGNVPAKLIINGVEHDVIVENITIDNKDYPYGLKSYFDLETKQMVHGETITTQTFICKKIITEVY